LRMSCLQERLGGLRALTDVFADANGEVVENAVSASNALASLDRCADVPLLRAVVRPPEDATTQRKVDELRKRLAELKAKFDAGGYRQSLRNGPALVDEARLVGYEPLMAEALGLLGTMQYKSNETTAAEASLVEAFRAADSARHDEVRAEVAVDLVYVVGYLGGRFQDGYAWSKTAEAILKRIGGHNLLRAWLLNDLGCVYDLKGNKEAAERAQQDALVLKSKALGENHPDLGVSEANLAMSLQGLGRSAEALLHVDRSIAVIESGLGVGHPDVAISLNNKGEILNALGRYDDARQAYEQAASIWQRELGADNWVLGYALTGIGVSFILEGNPSKALAPLERAFKIREASDSDKARKAETAFALARALGESNRDRPRARVLAEQAKAAYASGANKTKVTEIDAWLHKHDLG
jgi:tetratricopeptide (TPR) repeat protein